MGTYYATSVNLTLKKETPRDLKQALKALCFGEENELIETTIASVFPDFQEKHGYTPSDYITRMFRNCGSGWEDWHMSKTIELPDGRSTIRTNGSSKAILIDATQALLNGLVPYLDVTNGQILAKQMSEQSGVLVCYVYRAGNIDVVNIEGYYRCDFDFVNDFDHPKEAAPDTDDLSEVWDFMEFYPKAKERVEKNKESQNNTGWW